MDWGELEETEIKTGASAQPAPMWSAARSRSWAKQCAVADQMSASGTGGGGDGALPIDPATGRPMNPNDYIFQPRSMREVKCTPFKADQPFFSFTKKSEGEGVQPNSFDNQLFNSHGVCVFET